jgi:hypothetical protein
MLATAGCGNDVERTPVFKTTGKVTFQNQPAAGAFLVLHPKTPASPNDPRPNALIKPDGSFEATTFENADGAPAGEYVVTVEWRRLIQQDGDWKPGPNVLPNKYENPATSDIVVRVAEGENQLPEIVLRR